MIYDLPEYICGDTWKGITSITISFNGTPVNLEGCDIFLQVRSAKNSASPLVYEFSTIKNTIVIITANSGIINIPSQVVDIPPGQYAYDLKILFPNGLIQPYLKGEWEVLSYKQDE